MENSWNKHFILQNYEELSKKIIAPIHDTKLEAMEDEKRYFPLQFLLCNFSSKTVTDQTK